MMGIYKGTSKVGKDNNMGDTDMCHTEQHLFEDAAWAVSPQPACPGMETLRAAVAQPMLVCLNL